MPFFEKQENNDFCRNCGERIQLHNGVKCVRPWCTARRELEGIVLQCSRGLDHGGRHKDPQLGEWE